MQKSNLEAIATLHKNGIPLVFGSDSGNWPAFLSYFHGYGSIREFELLLDAGLSHVEVFKAATYRAARIIGRENQLGVIAVGKKADFLLFKASPLTLAQPLRRIDYVVKRGVMKSPSQWLKKVEL